MKFIIYTHSFNENFGGVIVLHQLCHTLNSLGHEAYLWPNNKPLFTIANIFNPSILNRWRLYKFRFKTYKNFDTPIAQKKDIQDSVVIYPEIINGNPLKAKKVTRWLLHKPGVNSSLVHFDPKDLIVAYGKEFSNENIVIDDNHTLTLKFSMQNIYKQTNFAARSGYCHMIRKGKGKEYIHPEESILLDNLSHQEISKVFNQCKYFISYDPYTYYSIYAVMCGSISIIVPDMGITKENWYPDEKNRYGRAYGLNDIEYAIQTTPLLLSQIEKQILDNNQSVESFVKLCQSYFSLQK